VPECPHRSISSKWHGWRCDWCGAEFMSKTREAAEDFIRRDDEQQEAYKEFLQKQTEHFRSIAESAGLATEVGGK